MENIVQVVIQDGEEKSLNTGWRNNFIQSLRLDPIISAIKIKSGSTRNKERLLQFHASKIQLKNFLHFGARDS